MNPSLTLLIAATLLPIAVAGAAQDKPKSGTGKMLDTGQNIVEKPLRDLNIIKPEVAPEVERIMAAPYDLSGMKTCAQYKAAVTKLTAVLGPDVDSPQMQKQDKSPAEVALGLGESAAGGIIPFSGVIRRLSGAEARQNYAKAVIYAGSVRRAYIKGMARAKGCRI